MNARTIRRAIERKARKQARKEELAMSLAANTPNASKGEMISTPAASEPAKPISAIQLEANRRNAQLSTGPRTREGKAASSQNNFKHGFCGAFQVLESESRDDFDALLAAFREEHQPSSPSEESLIEALAKHFWLGQRAMNLQTQLLSKGHITKETEKAFVLYLRYQGTHDRGFFKCLNELHRIRAEKRRAQHGFERQKLRTAADLRKQELHEVRVRTANAKAEITTARTLQLQNANQPLLARTQPA